jgi:hypothetical protein
MVQWVEFLDGAYAVSSEGEIKRLKRNKGATVGKVLAPSQNYEGGYAHVVVCVDREIRNMLVHRVVAEAFLGPCPDGCNVNHKNGNKFDNRASNLEYVTYSANTQHALRAGLIARDERGRFA